ncbi:hypothetical protein LIA61_004637 [Vibrio parahaemolyticus]|uniref:hypothetical protein n=1 Tax=Vibrio parahaemolyticus TaxID=670 RepID=UPI0012AC7F8F|nr:hypothetical protein [Vibrio parahaemolyticus]EIJ2226083.1 hypothetical protein [Vibrio parahaemolyticus]EJC6780078.1 hypothetical protein [Vibrio parahaemolyticus]EJG1843270.1 hypothetical protein [Vibrio parahaemolyticus]EKN4570159.1 hypothetical protein [Vibrio parahaemolyticus]WMO06184.1 hypothetical protein NI378_07070 [Vibrio parahaemolyticus]
MTVLTRILHMCTQIKWQLPLAMYSAVSFYLYIKSNGVVVDLSKGDLLSYTAGMATILALFCSVSFGFVLHHIQNSKSERLDALNHLSNEINRLKDSVYQESESSITFECERLIAAYEEIESFDYPLIEYPDEHIAFGNALSVELVSDSRFLRKATSCILNIENINTRLQVIAVKQITSRIALYTLTKGVFLVSMLICLYFAALVGFNADYISTFISLQLFCTIMTVFVFVEFTKDMRRFMDDELEFVDFGQQT